MSALTIIAEGGGQQVSPDMILPAAIPLELSGESVRARICTFTDENQTEWALRPDLTLPVALAEIEARRGGASGDTRRYYDGSVFRLPNLGGDPIEFRQVGVERFGAGEGAEAEADLYQTLCAACRAEGVTSGQTQLGDLAIFPAFVDALGLGSDAAERLKRAFRQEGGVEAVLNTDANRTSGLTQRLSGLSKEEIAAFVEDVFTMTGVRPVGERSADEIVSRLAERSQASAAAELDTDVRDLLVSVLNLDADAAQAPGALRTLAEGAGLTAAGTVIDQLEARLNTFAAAADGFMDGARFRTSFGRRFTYYDGFVFEVSGGDTERPFAIGGRYDSLLSALSKGEVTASAIGGVVIPYRLPGAKGGAS